MQPKTMSSILSDVHLRQHKTLAGYDETHIYNVILIDYIYSDTVSMILLINDNIIECKTIENILYMP